MSITDAFFISVAMVLIELNTSESDFTTQVTESDGALEVVLVLSKPVNQEVNVSVVATGLTATGLLKVFCRYNNNHQLFFYIVDKDFGPPENYIVMFPAGSIRQSVDIPIINDDVFELDETFKLEIKVPEEAFAFGVRDGCHSFTPIVKITDDDCKLYIISIRCLRKGNTVCMKSF